MRDLAQCLALSGGLVYWGVEVVVVIIKLISRHCQQKPWGLAEEGAL